MIYVVVQVASSLNFYNFQKTEVEVPARVDDRTPHQMTNIYQLCNSEWQDFNKTRACK